MTGAQLITQIDNSIIAKTVVDPTTVVHPLTNPNPP